MVLLFSLYFSLLSYADSESVLANYTYVYGGKKITAKIGKLASGARVNDVCLEKKNKCQALVNYQSKSRVNEIKKAIGANYPGAYCELLKGSQLFLKNGDAQESFCLFSDLTLIDARELYVEHSKQKAKP